MSCLWRRWPWVGVQVTWLNRHAQRARERGPLFERADPIEGKEASIKEMDGQIAEKEAKHLQLQVRRDEEEWGGGGGSDSTTSEGGGGDPSKDTGARPGREQAGDEGLHVGQVRRGREEGSFS
eukprot:764585-Hanusia_phi.AAC.9